MRKAVLLLAFLATPSLAQVPDASLSQRQLDRIAANPESFASTTLREMFALDPINGVADATSIERWDLRDRGMRLNSHLGLPLAFDHDGDFHVSRAEVAAVEPMLSDGHKRQIEAFFDAHDRDGNDILDPAEIRAGAEATLDERTGGVVSAPWHLLSFDTNGDGKATPEEMVGFVQARAGRQLAEIKAPNGQVFGGDAIDCTLPSLSATATTVHIKAYEGAALSTVSVAGRDAETTIARLEIEPGEAPLYIFATATTHVLWSLHGATERVEQFVVAQRDRGAGVAGLERGRVTLWDEPFCRTRISRTDIGTAQVVLDLTRADATLESYTIGDMRVPSGIDTIAEAEQPGLIIEKDGKRFHWGENGLTPLKEFAGDPHNRTRQELYRFHPLGIDSVAPEDVIARGTVEAYDILPQEAGLLQLLDAGNLTRRADGAYVIEKPFARFPAGLNGAHGVDFLLMPGIQMPAGDPGHSTVRRVDTGECLVERCR